MPLRGRHRRYKANRISRASLSVTAGGAGIALPLIGAAGASAASGETWNKVAQCESTSHWDINTGNGFYGGLQFTQSTWAAYSGTAYAARADLATKDQQIAVAEKVLDAQGPGAWPVCSGKAGLTRTDAAPQSAPKVLKASAAPAKEAQRPQKAQRTAASKPTPTSLPGASAKSGRYVVVSGDSLSGIADSHDVSGGWKTLYETNRGTVGDDPDLIYPGQKLSLTGGKATAKPKAKTETPDKAEAKAKAKAKPAPRQKAAKPQPSRERAAKPAASSGFIAPVSGVSPSTAYRAAGSSWSSGYHTGVDFPVSIGTSVKAVGTGQVVSAGWADAYGYQVVIRHPDGKYSQYAHLSQLSVRTGQSVNVGQQVGRSGATGNVTGPHLHFEIRTGPGYGSDINPLTYLRSHGVSL
ncbi:transglycosylase family protein [Streptomyces sp. S465]|uniref:transglycosylase family protein n=1 Tax=Streptomyces sp. S465 TaxID=2979468 RepID=UPI0022A897F2|nr:transglycosylase family protein [Streptomyces sp. S465]WAP53995.1 transglycosylase family protein [Streptomyces sp. S465]